MGNDKLDDLLISLEGEIERKCFRIREKKIKKTKERLFFLACFFVLLLPFLLLYLGLHLLVACLPVILFLAVSIISLLPIMIIKMEVM